MGQAGRPAAGAAARGALAPLVGRAWQLGCGARRVLTCWSGKLGKGAAGAGPGHDQPMGRRHSMECYITPGKWRGREPGESSELQSNGRPWRQPESPRHSWERRVKTQGLKMQALSASARSGRPRPCCLSPGLCCDTCSCGPRLDSAPCWTLAPTSGVAGPRLWRLPALGTAGRGVS